MSKINCKMCGEEALDIEETGVAVRVDVVAEARAFLRSSGLPTVMSKTLLPSSTVNAGKHITALIEKVEELEGKCDFKNGVNRSLGLSHVTAIKENAALKDKNAKLLLRCHKAEADVVRLEAE